MNVLQRALEWALATKKREYTLVLLLFAALTVVFTWPLVLHFHNGVIGGRGDTLLNSWIISWDAKTIFSNPTALFQGNIIYPSRDVLAYSEHLFVLGLLAAPLHHLFGNPVLAYNSLLFFGAIFSGFGCYLLMRDLTSSRWAGLAAGLFFAFCPYKLSKMGHLHVFFSPFLPFALLYEHRYLRKGGRRNLVFFGLFFLAQALSSWHYLIFTSLVVATLWVWVAVFTRRREDLMRLLGVAAAVAAAMLIVLPFALPYLRAHDRLPGFERSLEELEGYAAGGRDFLRVLPENLLYGDAAPPFELPGMRGESVLFPGFAVLALALLGMAALWGGRGKAAPPQGAREAEEGGGAAPAPGGEAAGEREIFPFRHGVLFPLLLLLLGLMLVLGPRPRGIPNPPFIALFRLGLLKFIRVPSRFYVLVVLALAMMAGYGMAWLLARLRAGGGGRRPHRAVPACLLIILLCELLSVNFAVAAVPVGRQVPEAYSWLAEQEGDVRVIELPTSPLNPAMNNDRDLGLDFADMIAFHEGEAGIVYFSTYHWKRIVNGYSGYYPYHYRRTITEMQGFPSRRTLEMLQALRVDYVVWDREAVQPQRRGEFNARLFSLPGLEMVEDFGDRAVFRVEPGPAAGPEALEVTASCPDAVPPAQEFSLGLVAANRGAAPFISLEEGSQRYRADFLDAEGSGVCACEGEFWGPFFLGGGEGLSIPLFLAAPREEGAYTLRLALADGVLGARGFTFPVRVAETPVSTRPRLLDGSLAAAGSIAPSAPDGLLPLTFEVVNSGDTLWRSAPRDGATGETGAGVVRIGVAWERGGKKVLGEQRCSLPGDVAPGQRVVVPTLVRLPAASGSFTLRAELVCELEGSFGEGLEIEVEIEGRPQEGMREAPSATEPARAGRARPAAHFIEAA